MSEWVKLFDSLAQAESAIELSKSIQFSIGDKKICLYRTKKGFFALADTCPHQGASLSQGHINAWNEVVCPLHSYKFNIQTGDETTGYGYKVKKYKVEIQNDALGVWIS